MIKAAEDFESISRRLKELEADKQLALTGSSAPTQEKVGEAAVNWAYSAAANSDYCFWANMAKA